MAKWQLKRRGGKVPTPEAIAKLEALKRLLRAAQRQHADRPLQAMRVDGMPSESIERVGDQIVCTQHPCKPGEPGVLGLMAPPRENASLEFNSLCVHLVRTVREFGVDVKCPADSEPGAIWLFIVTEVLDEDGKDVNCCTVDGVVTSRWFISEDVFMQSSIAIELLFASGFTEKSKRARGKERHIQAIHLLAEDDTLTQKEIAERVGLSPSALSRSRMFQRARGAVRRAGPRTGRIDPRTQRLEAFDDE